MIYFDGNHSKKATIAYFEKLLPTITNDSVDFDDIHWSLTWKKLEIIKEHSFGYSYHRCFQWGIVFLGENNRKNILLSEFKSKNDSHL
jgi:hypothetical protein